MQNPFKRDSTGTQRKPLRLSREDLVGVSELRPGHRLPLLIEPRIKRIDPVAWVASQRDWLGSQLAERGGILLRNFPLSGIAEFEKLMRAFSGNLMEYSYRSTPRHKVHGNVYTSTAYPPDQHIPLHNENSYAAAWPMKIGFFCQQPAADGGQTPIADSRRVYARIDQDVRERFVTKQVMYIRNYGSGIDLPWQTVFQTSERAEVEAYCQAARIKWEWGEGDRLRTSEVRQAVARHPRTGEMVWFNQAHLFHISNLDSDVRGALQQTFGEEGLPRQARYGDGSAIEDSALEEIRKAYASEAVEFDWTAADVLLLDNMLVAHSRRPYTGSRRVLVAMAESNAD
jgi:alpha-ketoglutarate-dependent taurine dioxygenase